MKNSERGNASAAFLIFVGGFSLMLSQMEFKSLSSRADQVKVEGTKSFIQQQNTSSLQLAARLLVPDQPAQPAPVYVDPYIPAGACDQNRKLKEQTDLYWRSEVASLTIKSFSQESLKTNIDDVFDRLSKKNNPSLAPDENTQLKVLGYKCSDDATRPFLVQGLYVEALAPAKPGQKATPTKALLAMAPPPPSSCHFYVQQKDGTPLPGSKVPSPAQEYDSPFDQGSLFLECNHVITDAKILRDGTQIAATNSFPKTAAFRIDPAYKVLLGPIPAVSGIHTYTAIAEQVDGSKVIMDFKLSLSFPAGSGSGKGGVCASQCAIVQSQPPVGMCNPAGGSHINGFQAQFPNLELCYHCKDFYGFDPANACAPAGIVGSRAMGCFEENIRIRMADGTDKLIKELSIGDRVWNPILKRGMPLRNVVRGPEYQGLYLVQIGEKELRVTRDHPFMSQLGLIGAKDLQAGDLVRGTDDTWQKVKHVKQEAPNPHTTVWNIELDAAEENEAHHMVLADGVVTGDLYLQNRITSRQLLEMLVAQP